MGVARPNAVLNPQSNGADTCWEETRVGWPDFPNQTNERTLYIAHLEFDEEEGEGQLQAILRLTRSSVEEWSPDFTAITAQTAGV